MITTKESPNKYPERVPEYISLEIIDVTLKKNHKGIPEEILEYMIGRVSGEISKRNPGIINKAIPVELNEGILEARKKFLQESRQKSLKQCCRNESQ